MNLYMILVSFPVRESTTSSSDDKYGGSDYSGGFGGKSQNITGPGGAGPMRSKFATALELQMVLASMTTDEQTALGHQIDDFIVDCEFAGTSCYKWYVMLHRKLNRQLLCRLL